MTDLRLLACSSTQKDNRLVVLDLGLDGFKGKCPAALAHFLGITGDYKPCSDGTLDFPEKFNITTDVMVWIIQFVLTGSVPKGERDIDRFVDAFTTLGGSNALTLLMVKRQKLREAEANRPPLCQEEDLRGEYEWGLFWEEYHAEGWSYCRIAESGQKLYRKRLAANHQPLSPTEDNDGKFYWRCSSEGYIGDGWCCRSAVPDSYPLRFWHFISREDYNNQVNQKGTADEEDKEGTADDEAVPPLVSYDPTPRGNLATPQISNTFPGRPLVGTRNNKPMTKVTFSEPLPSIEECNEPLGSKGLREGE